MKFPLTPEPLPNDPTVCTIEVAALLSAREPQRCGHFPSGLRPREAPRGIRDASSAKGCARPGC